MAKFRLLFCERCKAKLNPDMAVWLELDQRTGTYTDQPVPENIHRAGFPSEPIARRLRWQNTPQRRGKTVPHPRLHNNPE